MKRPRSSERAPDAGAGIDAAPGPPLAPGHGRATWLVAGLLALLLVGLSAAARVEAALREPALAAPVPEGALKSDPALLYYLTERILDAGGRPPADFRADPRIQHPRTTDVPAEFTVGQEFLLAWTYRAFGAGEPLHRFALRLMSLVASLTILGAFGLVAWRTRHPWWALGAAAFAAVLPANYRTIGFVLVREDLSLPFLALHLALLARAATRGGARAYLAAGLAAGAAVATWHAMGFLVALELVVLHLWWVARRASAFEARGAWAVLVGPVLAATLVPALRSNGFLLGGPLCLAWALVGTAVLRRRGVGVAGSLAGTALLLALLVGAGQLLDPGRSGYAHVYDALAAKLAHGGVRPEDPRAIPFAARLLWQGPFETLSLDALVRWLGWGALLGPLVLVVAARARRRLDGFDLWLLALGLVALPAAWLVARTVVLLGILLPAWVAVLARARRGLAAGLAFLVLLFAQGLGFAGRITSWRSTWYVPAVRQAEIAHLVRWVDEHLDDDQAITADFMNSTAILAHAGNPIVLQPKYETEDSRERARLFLETFFHGTPDELRHLARDRFRTPYLLIDRYTLGSLSAWTAGLVGPQREGTAAAAFLSTEATTLEGVPGFELVYRSPPQLRGADGRPSDFFRLYRLGPPR